MTLVPSDVAALSRLLDEAQLLPASRLEAWLAALRHEERHLVNPLRRMLADAADPSSGLLSTMPRLGGLDADTIAVARAGDRIGHYRLQREIGVGGMGSVWLAERADGHFERQVALKLPRVAWGERLAERMARERRIGALLEHPNIARLYDAGVEEHGRPYIAMEYIDGVAIDRWCRDRSLDIRATLKLYLQVIGAVAYAHGRLVIHRDLKPANVLVDGTGRAHLLDFGIAKLLADAAPDQNLTQEFGRMLTPNYAAPEQIAGQPIGIGADVYALGVTLYELLTGSLPHAPRRQTWAALEDAVLNDDARPASAVARDPKVRRALEGDIDAILAKALRRDPAQRYATAEAMADDIERHLAGETVHARPHSRSYRLSKAARRHKGAITAVAAVLATATIGSWLALLQAQRATRLAEETQIVTRFVGEMFRLNAGTSSAVPTAPGDFLDQTARLIETRFAGQPKVQSALYGAVGRVYVDIGAGNLALHYALRHLHSVEATGASDDDAVRALLLLADANRENGRGIDAEAVARKAVARTQAESILGLEARAKLALLALSNGKPAEAQTLVDATLAAWREPGPQAQSGLATLLNVQALLLSGANRFDEALPLARSAMDKALAAEGPQSWTANRLRIEWAINLVNRGRVDEARLLADAALASLMASGDAGRVRAAVDSSDLWARMAEMTAVDLHRARTEVEQNRARLTAFGQTLPRRIGAAVDFDLAQIATLWGDLQSADRLYRDSAPVLEASTDSVREHWLITTMTGMHAMRVGRHDEADGLLRKRLLIRIKAGRGHTPYAAYDWTNVAMNQMMSGDGEGAEEFLRQAPSFEAARGDKAVDYATAIPAVIARIRLDRNDVAGAMAVFPAKKDIVFEHDRGSLHVAENALPAEIQCAGNEPQKGLAALRLWIDVIAPMVSPNEPGLARVRAVAGLCALKTGDRVLARALGESARSALAAQPQVSPWFKAALVRLDRVLDTRKL